MVRVFALVMLLIALAAPAAEAQIFLQLEGAVQGPIFGGATSIELNTIQVTSFDQGVFVDVNPQTGIISYRSRSNVNISKVWDPSSIKLLRAQGDQELLTTCIFHFYLNGGVESEHLDRRMPMWYLSVQLDNARIESFSAAGSGGSNAAENLSLTYDRISFTYAPTGETFVDALRGPGAAKAAAWQDPTRTPTFRDGMDFVLPAEGHVGVEITDADGRWVTTLFDDDASRSEGHVRWDATDARGQKVPAGVYTATVKTSGAEITHHMVIGD